MFKETEIRVLREYDVVEEADTEYAGSFLQLLCGSLVRLARHAGAEGMVVAADDCGGMFRYWL